MKIIRPTCKACQSLAKAIDAYIAKVNDGLADEMSDAGYADAKDSVKGADQLEEDVKDILTTQTEELADVIEEAGTIPKAKKAVEQYFEDDVTGEELTETFIDYFSETVTDLSSSYMKMTEEDLDVTQLRKRTTAWINQWSSQLSQIMQLTSQQQIGSLLQNALDSGKGCDVFAQELIKNGIRKEAWRARATAVTEMLRAHSVARQEAIIQSPATDRKKWRHSGGHKNDPRENHVAMDGQIVPKAEPFVLIGIKGGTHYPMFPRDPELPPEESINCHCTHVPIANDNILGLSYEERKQMQQEIIAADDVEWERNGFSSEDGNESIKDVPKGDSDNKKRKKRVVIESFENPEEVVRGCSKTTIAVDRNAKSKKVKRVKKFEKNGVVYKVDGKDVKLDPSPLELEVADIIQKSTGKRVSVVPTVSGSIKGVQTPDYIIDGIQYDLKEMNGKGKEIVYNAIHKKSGQANRFIIVKGKTPYSSDEIRQQIERVFGQKGTNFVNEIMFIDGETIDVFKRNES